MTAEIVKIGERDYAYTCSFSIQYFILEYKR